VPRATPKPKENKLAGKAKFEEERKAAANAKAVKQIVRTKDRVHVACVIADEIEHRKGRDSISCTALGLAGDIEDNARPN
jgi:hypothetical protein